MQTFYSQLPIFISNSWMTILSPVCHWSRSLTNFSPWVFSTPIYALYLSPHFDRSSSNHDISLLQPSQLFSFTYKVYILWLGIQVPSKKFTIFLSTCPFLIGSFASYFSHSLSGIIQGDGKGLAKEQTLGLGLLRALRESTLSYYGKGDPKNFFLLFSPTMWSPQENQIVREGHCGLIVSPWQCSNKPMLPRAGDQGATWEASGLWRRGESSWEHPQGTGSLFRNGSRVEIHIWGSPQFSWLSSPFLLDLPSPPLLRLLCIWWYLIRTSPFWGIRALGCLIPSLSVLAPVTSWNMKDYALRPYSEPMRAETGRARPGAKEGRDGHSVSLQTLTAL